VARPSAWTRFAPSSRERRLARRAHPSPRARLPRLNQSTKEGRASDERRALRAATAGQTVPI
jgi:hypothetical protein